MSVRDAAFWLLGALALLAGWRVFRVDSMVRATFALLLSFVAVGAIMLLQGAPYLGAATLFMMAVEMMVMAVFMVMFMMNPAGLNPMNMVHQPRLAAGAGAAAFLGLSAAALSTDFPLRPVPDTARVIHDLGRELLGDSMLVFETAGVTLLATMVATVVLSSRGGRFGPASEGSLPPPLAEGGEPAGQRPAPRQGGMHGMHGGHDGHGGHGGHGAHGGHAEHPSHQNHVSQEDREGHGDHEMHGRRDEGSA